MSPVVVAVLAAGMVSCTADVEPRAQAVVHVDTNLSVPLHADTLRVDRLDESGRAIESRVHVAPNKSDWPVSFGVLPGPRAARFRLRLYLGTRVTSSTKPGALAEPLPFFTIDRLIEVAPPTRGVARLRVTLRGECVGVPADIAANTSCDDVEATVPASAGLERLDEAPSPGDTRVGTWPEAKERPCEGEPRSDGAFDGEVCVPGGFFFLGDERMASHACLPSCGTGPERPVRVSPFFLDKHEVTVGRFRRARAAGFVPKGAYTTAATSSWCTYRDDGVNDAYPMNCVTWQAAREFCAFDGGRALPTEAQWEFAASGRGREHLYVWGDDLPSCERAVFARFGAVGPPIPGTSNECKGLGAGLQKVGSRAAPGQDVSVDGALDLAGSLREWTADAIESYDRRCWAKPRLVDPRCDDATPGLHALRGGTWGTGTGVLAVAWRDGLVDGSDRYAQWAPYVGFRCARPGAPR